MFSLKKIKKLKFMLYVSDLTWTISKGHQAYINCMHG